MSKWFVAVVALVVALPMAGRAQVGRGRGRGAPPPRSVAGHGIDVPGWWARVDNPRGVGRLKLVSDGGMLHAMTGPGRRRSSGIRSRTRQARTRQKPSSR